MLSAWAPNIGVDCRSGKVLCMCAEALRVGGGRAPIVGASLVALGTSGVTVPGGEQWALMIDTGDGPTVPWPVLPLPSPDLAVRETTVTPFRLWRTSEGTIVELASAWKTTRLREVARASQVLICAAGDDQAIRCGTFPTGAEGDGVAWRRPVQVDADGRIGIGPTTGEGPPRDLVGDAGRYTIAELRARGLLPERLDRADRFVPDHGPLPGKTTPAPVVANDPLAPTCALLAEGAAGACAVARHLGRTPFPDPRKHPVPPVAGVALVRWRADDRAAADTWGVAVDTGAGWWLAHRWTAARDGDAVARFEQTWAGDRGTIFIVETAPDADGSADWLGCYAVGGQPRCVRLPARRGGWSRTLDVDLGYHLVTRREHGRRPDDIPALRRVDLDTLAGAPAP